MRRRRRVVMWSGDIVALMATLVVASERVAVLDECDPTTFNAPRPSVLA